MHIAMSLSVCPAASPACVLYFLQAGDDSPSVSERPCTCTAPVHGCDLSDYSVRVASADTWRHLRSANRQLLAEQRFQLNTYGRRAFSVASPTIWNFPGFHPGPDDQCRVLQTLT